MELSSQYSYSVQTAAAFYQRNLLLLTLTYLLFLAEVFKVMRLELLPAHSEVLCAASRSQSSFETFDFWPKTA